MTHYLTGEEPSEWVYYVRHVIAQVGGKTYPDGILVAGINSWIPYDQAYLAGAAEKTEASEALEQSDRTYVETRQEELGRKTDEEKAEIRRKADEVELEVLKPIDSASEPARTTQDTAAREQKEYVDVRQDMFVPSSSRDTAKQDTPVRPSQWNRFSLGARGGLASLLHATESDLGKWKPGFDVALDLQYAHYWLTKKDHNLGLLVGASVAYSMSSMTTKVDDSFKRETVGGTVEYNVSATEVRERDGEVLLEVPLMFSMISRQGIFLNVGPRFSVPVYAHYKQTMSDDVSVSAYFPEYGVTVPNEPVTGALSDEQKKQPGRWSAAKMNIMLSGELGYEFMLMSGNSLGLGVYANYSVYTLYKNDTSNESLVGVTNPEWNKPAPINVLSATDTYAKGIGYFDIGIKVAYHLNFPKLK